MVELPHSPVPSSELAGADSRRPRLKPARGLRGDWDDAGHYDWILGSDILYGEPLHPDLRRIFESNLSPVGRLLIADPFRGASLRLLETLEGDGWRIAMTRWDVGEETTPGPIGVFELTPPRSGDGEP
jgi:hypothetical protein